MLLQRCSTQIQVRIGRKKTKAMFECLHVTLAVANKKWEDKRKKKTISRTQRTNGLDYNWLEYTIEPIVPLKWHKIETHCAFKAAQN